MGLPGETGQRALAGPADGRAGATDAEAAMDAAIWAELSPHLGQFQSRRGSETRARFSSGRSGSWPEKRRSERLRRASSDPRCPQLDRRIGAKKKKCGDASVAAGVPTLLSLAVIDQLRRRVGPGATVVCAARAPWGSGRLPPAKARRWSLLLLEKRPLRWWRRRREAARADVRFFLRGSCQSAGSERGRGARLPHTNRARRKNAELETRRTDARRRKKKQARGGAHAPAALPRPDWPGVTWAVTS